MCVVSRNQTIRWYIKSCWQRQQRWWDWLQIYTPFFSWHMPWDWGALQQVFTKNDIISGISELVYQNGILSVSLNVIILIENKDDMLVRIGDNSSTKSTTDAQENLAIHIIATDAQTTSNAETSNDKYFGLSDYHLPSKYAFKCHYTLSVSIAISLVLFFVYAIAKKSWI